MDLSQKIRSLSKSFYLPESQVKKIEQLSEENGLPMSTIVEEALKMYFEYTDYMNQNGDKNDG
jgi:predicted DNA-binding protein